MGRAFVALLGNVHVPGTHLCVCLHSHTRVHTHARAHTHAHTDTCTHAHPHTGSCMRALLVQVISRHTNTHLCAYTCTHAHAHTHTRTRTCTHTNTHAHTCTHTHTCTSMHACSRTCITYARAHRHMRERTHTRTRSHARASCRWRQGARSGGEDPQGRWWWLRLSEPAQAAVREAEEARELVRACMCVHVCLSMHVLDSDTPCTRLRKPGRWCARMRVFVITWDTCACLAWEGSHGQPASWSACSACALAWILAAARTCYLAHPICSMLARLPSVFCPSLSCLPCCPSAARLLACLPCLPQAEKEVKDLRMRLESAAKYAQEQHDAALQAASASRQASGYFPCERGRAAEWHGPHPQDVYHSSSWCSDCIPVVQ